MADINSEVRRGLDLRSSELVFDEPARLLFGGKGPLWYRGFHYEMEDDYPIATSEGIDSILNYFGVSAIVVGHTGVDSVLSLFESKVYAIDVPYEDMFSLEALLWENGRFYRITGSGEKKPLE